MNNSITFAICANFCFSLASIFFARYAQEFGSLRFNTFKCQIALGLFLLTVFFYPISAFPSFEGLIFLMFSGVLGLAIGDIFLFYAFREIGPARTLTLFGLRPIMIALMNFFILGVSIKSEDVYPTIFFILCLLTYARENYKQSKSFQLKGILAGILGVFLDSCAVILTRSVFDANEEMTTFHANLIRSLAALVALKAFCLVKNKNLSTVPFARVKSDKALLLSPILGTYLALIFFIQAIKEGNLIIISAIGITGPIFASIFESVINKKAPSKYLYIALFFFIGGVALRAYLMSRT